MFDFRVLSQEHIKDTLDMTDAIGSNMEVYEQRALGQTDTWPTIFRVFEEGGADMDIKSGWLRSSGVFGHKTIGWYGRNADGGMPPLVGLICIFDAETGVPLGIVDGGYVTSLRTGAAGGIGAKLLARPDSETLLIIGSGNQSGFQAAAVLSLMPRVKRVMVANPHRPEAARDRVAQMPQIMQALGAPFEGVDFEVAQNLEEAVGRADIVVTCTMSREPLVKREWVSPGTHFSCIGADAEGKVELDPAIVADALLFVDDKAHCLEAGEIEVGLRQGAFSAGHIKGEIGDLICGKVEGRTSPDQITVFDSTGMALLDLACARAAIDQAHARGIGVEASI